MKKILSLLAVILFAAIGAFSQAPGIFNYQGVARNSVGNVLQNQSITLRLSIHDVTSGGPIVYQERRGVTTNPFGLFNIQVGDGGGIVTIGTTVSAVNWGVGNKYIQVEIDPAGGTTFINIGTAQIASVPYALFSTTASDLVLPFLKTQADAGTLFRINNSGTGISGAIMGTTLSPAANAWGVQGQVNNVAAGGFSAGVLGTNLSTTGNGIGVMGTQNGSGWGVYGTSPSGIGVNGLSTSGTGVSGASTSGIGVFGTSSTSNAGRFSNTNAANSASTVLISTNSTNNTALSVTGPGIWGSAIGITNTTSGMEWRTSVNGNTYTVTKIPGATFSPFLLFSDGQVEFPSTTGANRLRILDNGNVGINTATPTYKLEVVHAGSTGILTRGTAGFSVNDVDASNGDAALRFLNAGAFRWNIRNDPAGNDLQVFDMGASVARLRLLTANGNLGIATAAPAYRLDVDATTAGSSNGIRVRNTGSFATVDIVGATTDQALRFGKNGAIWSGINTLPDGDHMTFFKFGVGNLMALNVNTGNLGVGGTIINPVAKVHARGFNVVNNLYSSSTGFLGATGIGSNDITAQPTNEKWGIHTFVNGAVGTQHAIFAEPGTTAAINTGLFGRVSTAPAGGQSFGLFAFDPVNTAATWAATIRGRLQYQDGTQANNFVLRSDATGNANWIDPAVLFPGAFLWTRVGTNLWNTNLGDDVGVGTVAPTHRFTVSHGGATGISVSSTASFSVVDINAANGDAALRFGNAGTNQWNIRNRPGDNYLEIFELGGGGSRMAIQDATGNVGIGNTGATIAYRLDVQHGGATGIRSQSTASFSVVDIDAASGDAALRFQRAGVGEWNTRNNPGTDDYQIFELGGGGERLQIQDGTGNVGIGGISPAYRLDVQHGGATGVHVVSTASFSVVDIDAASGDAALRFQRAGVNQWNIRNRPADNYLEIFELGGGGSRMAIQDATGNVGIGNTGATIAYRLDVQHGGATGIRSQSTASFSVVDIDAASGDAALRFANAGVNQWNTRNDPASNNYQIFELGGGGERLQIQDGTGNIGIGGISPGYRLDVRHGGATGVHVVSTATFSVVDIDAANGDAALRFQRAGVNQWNTRNNPATNDYQIFELGGGGERLRINDGTGKVVISGDLDVVGTLTKGAGAFKIDHPLDPANKYLVHSFVESPDMMNIYNGNIVTDASGKATVQLPDYFQALNMEFRYQLTVIGAFAQAIINKEVSNNQFEIATNQPNVKVSWQVTGIRHDAYAEKNRIPNTVEKEAKNKGKYLSPESFNQPKSKGINYTDPNEGVTSIKDVELTPAKVANPLSTTGGSLEYTAPKTATNKPVDNSGSVANVEPAKAVVKTLDISGSVIQTEANKPSTKKADNSGSVSEEMQKPVIKTQEQPKAAKTIEPAKQVKEILPAVLKGTSMDPDAKPIVPAATTPDVKVPAQNSGNTQPPAEQKQVSKENNSVPSSTVPVKKQD